MSLLLLLLTLVQMQPMVLFDFTEGTNLDNWRIVDHVVMGGMSQGSFYLNESGHGTFSGKVSLENYGGFSSVRYNFSQIDVQSYSHIQMRLKGDGKRYQFRVKSSRWDRHSYVYTFQTSGEWETINIPLAEMMPQFRGRQLRMENYPGEKLEEIAFLIGNKRAEKFNLELDDIILVKN